MQPLLFRGKGERPLFSAAACRYAPRPLQGSGAGLVDVVVVEIRQEPRRALFLAYPLKLAPRRLAGDPRAPALAGVEIAHELIDIEVL